MYAFIKQIQVFYAFTNFKNIIFYGRIFIGLGMEVVVKIHFVPQSNFLWQLLIALDF